MKHPVKKTIALLIAACFLLGNTAVFADNVEPINIPAINSEMPAGVSVDVGGTDGTTVCGDEGTYFEGSGEPINSITVNVESINNTYDADTQPAGESASSGLYVSNAGANEVNVNVEKDVTNTGSDLDQTIGVQTQNSCDGETDIQIKGDVNAIATGENNTAIGIDAVVTNGNLSVSANDVTAKGESEAIGVRINLSDLSEGTAGNTVNVTTKDITATGENAVGIEITGNDEAESQIKVISDGTVSGDAVAVRVNPGDNKDTSNINLTLWSLKENENGQIVNVNDSLEPEAKKAAAEIEARINYIIKLADGWKGNISITTAKGSTEVINGQTYHTAKENEIVTFKVNVPVLDGIFYTDEDENTYTAVNNLTRNADGSYSIKMLRGGSMMLGLKTHTHNRLDRQENTDTGYDIVTYCTICGAELDRAHYNQSPSAQPPAVPDASISTEVSLAPAAEAVAIVPKSPATADIRTAAASLPSFNAADNPDLSFILNVVEKRFVAVDENTAVHGVKAADRLPIENAFSILGKNLNDEQAAVTIGNMDQLLNTKELTQFESLGASDCLMVLPAVLGSSDFLQVELYNMSPGAKALAEEITTRISNMTDDEKEGFNKQIQTIFNLQKILVDDHEFDSISIELTITKNGKETKERYYFFNDDNIWILYKIEQLQLVIG